MNIKLTWHTLNNCEYKWNNEKSKLVRTEIPIHTRVCNANGCKSLGIIVNIKRYKGTVEVLWLTGPKKGKNEVKLKTDLVNYDLYKQAIDTEVARLETMESEARMAGL